MGASGAIVMSFFGAVFASMTLLLQLQCRGLPVAFPFVGFAVIATAAVIALRLPGPPFVKPERSGKVILWSSAGEGIALFVVNEALIGLGRVDLIIPAMVSIVGLHFVPIAFWAPFRQLYLLAAVMVIAGMIGLIVTQPLGGTITGFTAAAALAAASVAAVCREWSAKAG